MFQSTYFKNSVVFFSAGLLLRWISLGLPSFDDLYYYWVASDGTAVAGVLQLMREEGWLPFTAVRSSRLGFPETFFFPQSPIFDSLIWLMMRGLSEIFDSAIAGYNSYFVVGAGLISLTMGLLCLTLKLNLLTSLLCALIFSAMPFGFERMHHLHLSSYFQIPLFLYVLLNLEQAPRKRTLIAIGATIGLTGLYFAFFSLSTLSVISMILILTTRKSRRFVVRNWVLTVSSCLFMIGLAFIPVLKNQIENGNAEIFKRAPQESLIWGLFPPNMLLPPTTHPLPSHSEIRPAIFSWESLNSMKDFEGYNEYIGITAILGVFLGVYLLFRKRFAMPERAVWIASLAGLWNALLGVKYGIGTFIAFFLSPSVRSYNRVSIFVAAAGLIAFFLWLNLRLRNTVERKRNLIVVAIALLTLLDLGTFWRPIQPMYEETKSDQKFARLIKEAVNDLPIIKLPFGVYPEWSGYPSVEIYSPFRFLTTEKIHSAFPAIKGTRPTEVKVALFFGKIPTRETILNFGLAGVVIDTTDIPEYGREALARLAPVANKRIESPNKRFVFLGFR